MKVYNADFHVHIGRAKGRPVKIAASSNLTLANVLEQALTVKGLDIVTLIDGVCDHVLTEVREAVSSGELVPVAGGGMLYRGRLLVLLGAEIELAGPFGKAAHFGCWLPDLAQATDFNAWLRTVQKNTQLSSQRAYTDAATLMAQTHARNGLFVIHHAFTPFKGILGSCVARLADFLDVSAVDALELGLSSDTAMADCLSELSGLTFLSNSDAHGLGTIAREYNRVQLDHLSFAEVKKALRRCEGRGIVANFGLHPQHGKYFRSRCRRCDQLLADIASPCQCPDGRQHVMGVWDRLMAIADQPEPLHPAHRPPYTHHVPLVDIPGIGAQTYRRLIAAYGSELAVQRLATTADLSEVVGAKMAAKVMQAEHGDVVWEEGGAGTYGKLRL